MSASNSTDLGNLYNDVLRKVNGDHARAAAAMEQLGLPIPEGCGHATPGNTACGLNAGTPLVCSPVPDIVPITEPPPAYICPLSGMLMRHPVLLETGRSYERQAISAYLEEHDAVCPASRRVLSRPITMTPDYNLQANIQAWCVVHAPHLLNSYGALLPPRPNEFGAGPGASAAYDRMPPLRPLPPRPSTANAHAGNHLLMSEQELADLAVARQLYEEDLRAGAYKVPSEAEPVPSAVPDLRPVAVARRLAPLRWLSFGLAVLWLVGFLLPLGFGDWVLASVAENPWLGPDADALLRAGATCSACIADGEWWRLLSAPIVVGGMLQAVMNALVVNNAAFVAAHAGVGVGAFAACAAAGGLGGSLVGAVAVDRLVFSASTAVSAACAAVALVGLISVRRRLHAWAPAAMLLSLWLLLVGIACLAPFADVWATAAGAVVGAIAGLAAVLPNVIKKRWYTSERAIAVWQGLLAGFVVLIFVTVSLLLIRKPFAGYKCHACEEVSCQDMLGWSCASARQNGGRCEFLVFPDATMSVVCPSGQRSEPRVVDADTPAEAYDALCRSLCSDDNTSNAPQPIGQPIEQPIGQPGSQSPPNGGTPSDGVLE